MGGMVAESSNSLSDNDWALIANWIRAEKELRAAHRTDKEKIWKEIDRQIAMTARVRREEEKVPAWYPATELPLQFNAVEVIAADARRLIFPRSGSWYRVSAEVSDQYIARWMQNRMANPLVGSDATPVNLDQETADAIVRSVIDYYHDFYNFKGSIDLFLAEQIKYGTGCMRVRPVRKLLYGKKSGEIKGPAVIPCSIWNTYLDDSWATLLHEGEFVGPSGIRCIWQPLVDVQKAANSGGDGWMPERVSKLVGKTGPDDRRERVELIEFEGDVLAPRSEGSIFLPNVIVTVAVGNSQDVVRFRQNPMPFRSYIVGHYFKHDVRHAYGDSPLVKGQPLQEMATEMANDLMAVGRLNALPPVAYDRFDPNLVGMGGPQIFPGAQWPTDAPNAIEPKQIGDPVALLNAYVGILKQYEDTTGNTEGRRGQRLKSHTTADAANIEAAQGISRTEDFVADQLSGCLRHMLHMEYEIIKKVMTKPQGVPVNSEGIDGWINLMNQDLPDDVDFRVVGAEGAFVERERATSFVEATAAVLQAAQLAMTAGIAVPVNFEAIAREIYERFGVNNTSKFIGSVTTIAGGAALESAIPGIAGGDPALAAATGSPVEAPIEGQPGPTIQ